MTGPLPGSRRLPVDDDTEILASLPDGAWSVITRGPQALADHIERTTAALLNYTRSRQEAAAGS